MNRTGFEPDWIAHTELRRSVDNLTIALQAVGEAKMGLIDVRAQYEFEDEAVLDGMIDHLETVEDTLSQQHVVGEDKVKVLVETLTAEEANGKS